MLYRYSNRLTQVRALERLLASLPSLDEPHMVVERAPWRSVRRLNDKQIDQLVADYQAGQTVYELAAKYGINRKSVSKHLHARLRERGVVMRGTQGRER